MKRYTRREALHAGLLGAGALAVGGLLEACGSSARVAKAASINKLLQAEKAAGDKTLQAFLAGQDYVSGVDNYVGIFLAHAGANGTRIFKDNARVWFSPTANQDTSFTPTGPLVAPWYGYAQAEPGPATPKGLNAVHFTFDRVGYWTLIVETTSGENLIGTTAFQVNAQGHTNTLIQGQKAHPTVTPTVANPAGVNPICTRTPPCMMHDITLADAISNGKPTAFIVATPEFCQSRNCGPSLDELITVQTKYKTQANFVHAEVYLNAQQAGSQNPQLTPAMTEWGLLSEPWLFMIDKTGVIASRFEGGFTADLAEAALKPLL
ncbi:MAG TPA: hypothetical protein VFW71_00905 [Actinomycetota bacterium]|nr:hypothetical protein [Actinomycetota bacterium]